MPASITHHGLLAGLLVVALVQVFLVLPYYYLLRSGIISAPYVQQKVPERKPFMAGLASHVARPGGFLILTVYLCSTWMAGLMPPSYYNHSVPEGLDVLSVDYLKWIAHGLQNVNLGHVALQLLVNDFLQGIMHLAEHKWFYTSSHKPHHKFVSPTLFDAFDGTVLDTSVMILIPLFITANLLSAARVEVNVWSYMAFGTTYANYLCLIHSEYHHLWDKPFKLLGIGTPADHHVHHRLFNKNYGHLFTYFDRIMGTYKDPTEVKRYFLQEKKE